MFSVNCINSCTKIRLLKCFSPYFSLHNSIPSRDFRKSCSAHLWNMSQPSTGTLEAFHSSKEGDCTIEQLIISRWREIRACNSNTYGESKGQNFHDNLMDLTCLSAAIDPKAPIY